MQPKTKNATFATQCNPYQKLRYNSKKERPLGLSFFGADQKQDSNPLNAARVSAAAKRRPGAKGLHKYPDSGMEMFGRYCSCRFSSAVLEYGMEKTI